MNFRRILIAISLFILLFSSMNIKNIFAWDSDNIAPEITFTVKCPPEDPAQPASGTYSCNSSSAVVIVNYNDRVDGIDGDGLDSISHTIGDTQSTACDPSDLSGHPQSCSYTSNTLTNVNPSFLISAAATDAALNSGSGSFTLQFITYSVSGFVYLDNDNNGTWKGAPEEPLYNENIKIDAAGPVTGSSAGPQGASGYTIIPNLIPGNYIVSYDASSLPLGYSFTYLSSYSLDLTAGCVADTVVPPRWSCDASKNVIGLNFGIIEATPWIQTTGGDIRFDNGFSSNFIPYNNGDPDDPPPPLPPGKCTKYASITNSDGTKGSSSPGIIFSGNSAFSGGQASNKGWTVNGADSVFTPIREGVMRTSYNYYKSLAEQNGINPTNLTSVCSDFSNCILPAGLASGIYRANGNLTLEGASSPNPDTDPLYTFPDNRNVIILVDGDLTLKTNIAVPNGSTVTFSASQDIYVDENIGLQTDNFDDAATQNLQGFYSADHDFIIQGNAVCPASPDKRLNIGGSVVVNAGKKGGSLINNRTLCEQNKECPVFSVIERPDFYLYAPDFLMHSNFTWQEVAP